MDMALIRKNILFRGFSDEEAKEVISRLSPRHQSLKKHNTAVYDGEKISEIGIVLSGCLRLSHIDENGNCNLMEVLYPP